LNTFLFFLKTKFVLPPTGLDTQRTMKLPVVFRLWANKNSAFPNAEVVSVPACLLIVGTIPSLDLVLRTCRDHCLIAFPFFILHLRLEPVKFAA
jgi:hypothetical protein